MIYYIGFGKGHPLWECHGVPREHRNIGGVMGRQGLGHGHYHALDGRVVYIYMFFKCFTQGHNIFTLLSISRHHNAPSYYHSRATYFMWRLVIAYLASLYYIFLNHHHPPTTYSPLCL